MDPLRRFIAGNWKMHGLQAALQEIGTLADLLAGPSTPPADVLICPPATLLPLAAERFAARGILFGGQTCHHEPAGAYTGELSAEQLADAGATHCIVGHSERRLHFGETSAQIRQKAEAVLRAGMTAIVCIGESEAERQSDDPVERVLTRLSKSLPQTGDAVIVSYEPYWAIGTGRTPSPAEIEVVIGGIRQIVGAEATLLYGGSVKPANAASILSVPGLNGALIGGASLKAEDFYGIITAS